MSPCRNEVLRQNLEVTCLPTASAGALRCIGTALLLVEPTFAHDLLRLDIIPLWKVKYPSLVLERCPGLALAGAALPVSSCPAGFSVEAETTSGTSSDKHLIPVERMSVEASSVRSPTMSTYRALAALGSHFTAHKHFSLSVCVATHSLLSSDQIFALPSYELSIVSSYSTTPRSYNQLTHSKYTPHSNSSSSS